MKIFEFEIKELLSKIIEVEAESEGDAYIKIKQMYHDEQIVLTADDYVDTEILHFQQ